MQTARMMAAPPPAQEARHPDRILDESLTVRLNVLTYASRAYNNMLVNPLKFATAAAARRR